MLQYGSQLSPSTKNSGGRMLLIQEHLNHARNIHEMKSSGISSEPKSRIIMKKLKRKTDKKSTSPDITYAVRKELCKIPSMKRIGYSDSNKNLSRRNYDPIEGTNALPARSRETQSLSSKRPQTSHYGYRSHDRQKRMEDIYYSLMAPHPNLLNKVKLSEHHGMNQQEYQVPNSVDIESFRNNGTDTRNIEGNHMFARGTKEAKVNSRDRTKVLQKSQSEKLLQNYGSRPQSHSSTRTFSRSEIIPPINQNETNISSNHQVIHELKESVINRPIYHNSSKISSYEAYLEERRKFTDSKWLLESTNALIQETISERKPKKIGIDKKLAMYELKRWKPTKTNRKYANVKSRYLQPKKTTYSSSPERKKSYKSYRSRRAPKLIETHGSEITLSQSTKRILSRSKGKLHSRTLNPADLHHSNRSMDSTYYPRFQEQHSTDYLPNFQSYSFQNDTIHPDESIHSIPQNNSPSDDLSPNTYSTNSEQASRSDFAMSGGLYA